MCSIKLLTVLFAIFYVLPNSHATQVDVTDHVVFNIKIGDSEPQTVVIGVFGNVVPITAKNFVAIASGLQGLSYKGSKFHRIIQNFMIQGGDITSHDGRGSVSIYGRKFDDENFDLKHSEPGLLSMANAGPNSNGSQFFVTTVITPWLDGKHTVFGKVLEGFDVIKQIEALQTDQDDRPVVDVVIVSSSAQQVNQKISLNQ